MNADEYLLQHGLDPEFIRKKLKWHWEDSMITIPIHNTSGEFLFNKYRLLNNAASKFKADKGSRASLYGINHVKAESNVVLCEGEPDTAKLLQEGVPAVCSTGGAMMFDESMARQLIGKTIYICFDTDETGHKGVLKAAEVLTKLGIEFRIIQLPPNVKDVCEYYSMGMATFPDFKSRISEAKTIGEWELNQASEDFRLISGAELIRLEFPENQWIIDKILPQEGFCFIFGAEGTGKSLITMSLAKSISEGKDWLDLFKIPKSENVLIIDKENSLRMIKDRAEVLGLTSKKVSWLARPEKLAIRDDAGNYTDFAETIALRVRLENIQVIIIDSFTDLLVGKENSREDTQVFFDSFKDLFPGKAILALHHENKPFQGVQRDSAHRSRGSTNINAQVSTMFRLEKSREDQTLLTLQHTKARDSMLLDKFRIRMIVKEWASGKTVVTGFKYEGICIETDDSAISAIIDLIRELFKNQEILSKKQIE